MRVVRLLKVTVRETYATSIHTMSVLLSGTTSKRSLMIVSMSEERAEGGYHD
jgi:hypothetical protein